MEIKEFLKKLEEDGCEYKEKKIKEKAGYLVRNNRWETNTHFTKEVINENEYSKLFVQTIQGFDVDQITRITGYFVRVSAANKGKLGEIRDRYRSGI